ncbi:MAG: ATP-binding protein, partial [Desulfatiglandales bacterium]
MSTGDVDALLIGDYNKYKKKADGAKASGNYEEAGELYAKCSRIMAKLSGMTDNKTLKEKRSALAQKLGGLGDNLKQGKLPSKRVEGGGRAAVSGEVETEDEFETYADSLISKSTVKWGEIGGLEPVKSLIKETIVISAVQRPDAIKPWKGILLFGPPGTGKTLLASATAGSLEATFFDVSVGQVLSKYYGESSKIVTAIFNAARRHTPSIVFLDEFDSIALSRGADIDESSRRTLSSLLSELDGFQDKGSDLFLLTIAATNTPWDLDTAVLSRFPKRIYVPLPDETACEEIIKIHTVKGGLELEDDVSPPELAKRSVEKMYAGRDLKNLCTQAIWNMVKSENPDLGSLAD